MDLINFQSSERVDLADLSFALGETPLRFQSATLQLLFSDPDVTPTMSVLRGFGTTTSGSTSIAVAKGAAILRRRVDADVSQLVVTAGNPTQQIIDTSGFAAGTYGVYIRFKYANGTSSSRTFWDGGSGGFEYAAEIPVRRLASWEARIEASLPGAEWMQVATIVLPARTLTDARSLFFEGDAIGGFANSWGSTNDRSTDRATYGVGDLRRFSAAMRQCLEDIRGRGLRKWYDKSIGGLMVGFEAEPIEDRIAVGDSNFFLQGDTVTPALAFSGSANALSYSRSNSKFSVLLSSVEKLAVSAAGAAVTGTLSASGATTLSSTLSVSGTASLANATCSGTLGVTGATSLTSATASGTLGVSGLATLSGGLSASGTAALANATVSGTLGVTGLSTLSGGLSASGTSALATATVSATLGVTGLATLSGGLSASGTASLASATVSGTLGVTGVTTLVDTKAKTLYLFDTAPVISLSRASATVADWQITQSATDSALEIVRGSAVSTVPARIRAPIESYGASAAQNIMKIVGPAGEAGFGLSRSSAASPATDWSIHQDSTANNLNFNAGNLAAGASLNFNANTLFPKVNSFSGATTFSNTVGLSGVTTVSNSLNVASGVSVTAGGTVGNQTFVTDGVVSAVKVQSINGVRLLPLDMGYLYNSAGQTYSASPPCLTLQNFNGSTIGREAKSHVMPFTGSIVALGIGLTVQSIPSGGSITVTYQRNGGTATTLATFNTTVVAQLNQNFTKNSFPVTIGEKITLAVTTSYSCTAVLQFDLTIEADVR